MAINGKASPLTFAIALAAGACTASSEEKVAATDLWTPEPTKAEWVYTSLIEGGTKYEAKRYHWLSAARQVGTLTIVPRLDDSKDAQSLHASVPTFYRSTVSLAAFECSTQRSYKMTSKRYTYYEENMGRGRAVLNPPDSDPKFWMIGSPPGESVRLDMLAVCAHIKKLSNAPTK